MKNGAVKRTCCDTDTSMWHSEDCRYRMEQGAAQLRRELNLALSEASLVHQHNGNQGAWRGFTRAMHQADAELEALEAGYAILVERIRVLETALRFYRDAWPVELAMDEGNRARDALAGSVPGWYEIWQGMGGGPQ